MYSNHKLLAELAHTPLGQDILKILGFVEELIVEDDPEYHWMDSFRFSRSTNDMRMKILFHISGYNTNPSAI